MLYKVWYRGSCKETAADGKVLYKQKITVDLIKIKRTLVFFYGDDLTGKQFPPPNNQGQASILQPHIFCRTLSLSKDYCT